MFSGTFDGSEPESLQAEFIAWEQESETVEFKRTYAEMAGGGCCR